MSKTPTRSLLFSFSELQIEQIPILTLQLFFLFLRLYTKKQIEYAVGFRYAEAFFVILRQLAVTGTER